MREAEARQAIVDRASVRRQHVTIAKAYILKHLLPDTSQLLREFLVRMGCELSQSIEVVLHPTVDPEPAIRRASDSILWQTAFCEAIWNLIHDGLLIQASPNLFSIKPHIKWTTVVRGSGGYSSGWSFDESEVFVPGRIRSAPSQTDVGPQPLTDGDLYLAEIDISDIHTQVAEALRDAVRCFRHELYVPCLAMLGKASEGVWIELGMSLLEFASSAAGLKPEQVDKMRRDLSSPFASIAQKMQTVTQLYDKQDIFRPVSKKSGADNRDLKQAAVWSDVVRDSRNVVHYGAESAIGNTYEKVAALLLGAASHIRLIYRIRRAAEELSKGPP